MATNDDERRTLSALADELLDHVAELRRHYVALAELLQGADEGAEHEGEGDEPEAAELAPAADPIQLLAVEMALAGKTREEVDEYVRENYGFTADPAVLDRVFER